MIATTQRRAVRPLQATRPGADRLPAPFVLGQTLHRVRRSVSTTPGLLRLGLGGIWVLSAVTLLAAYLGIDRHRHEMQAIGKDSAPSIVAAQQIRGSLADMQVNVAKHLLEGTDDGSAAGGAKGLHSMPNDPDEAYERCRRAAATALVAAAENITYGDGERVPIQTIVFAMGTFEQDVARARVLHQRHDPAYLYQLREAERVLHLDLLPAADALNKANLDALDNAYSSERFSSGLGTAFFVAAAALLLAGLIAVQLFLFRRTRRVFNLPLIGASVVLALLVAFLVASLLNESHELKVVKEDCFDSINALSRARAYAYDARGYQLLALLDPQRGDVLGRGFSENAAKLVKLDAGETLQSVVLSANGNGFTGCLADELHNITFDGEQEAAAQALRGYADYLSASAVATRLSAAGDTRAVQIALSNSPDVSAGGLNNAGPSSMHGCGYAFTQFDAALGQTLAINQREFDAALERGMAGLQGRLAASFVATGLIAILTYVGLRPRLMEYAS